MTSGRLLEISKGSAGVELRGMTVTSEGLFELRAGGSDPSTSLLRSGQPYA